MTTLEQQLRPAGRPKNRFTMSSVAYASWKASKPWGPDPRPYLKDLGLVALDEARGFKVDLRKLNAGGSPYFYVNLQTADGGSFTLPGVLHTDDFKLLVEKWGLFNCEWSDAEKIHYGSAKPDEFSFGKGITGPASAGFVWMAVLEDQKVRLMHVRGWPSQLPPGRQFIGLLGTEMSCLPDPKLLVGHRYNEAGPKSTELMNALYERSREWTKAMFLGENGLVPHYALIGVHPGFFKL